MMQVSNDDEDMLIGLQAQLSIIIKKFKTSHVIAKEIFILFHFNICTKPNFNVKQTYITLSQIIFN